MKMMANLLTGILIALCVRGSLGACSDYYEPQYEREERNFFDGLVCNNTYYYYYAAAQCAQIFPAAVSQFLQGNSNSSIFQQLCTEGVECFKECMMEKFANCSAEFWKDIEDIYIPSYVDNFCNGEIIATHLEPYEGTFNQEAWINTYAGLGCDLGNVWGQFSEGSCLHQLVSLWYDDNITPAKQAHDKRYPAVQYRPFRDSRERLSRKIQSLFACIVNNATLELKKQNCETEDYAFFGVMAIYIYSYYVIPGVDYSLEELLQLFTVKENPGEIRRHTCAVFGDPHLYIFNENGNKGEYITCEAPGKQNVLSNNYVDITGFNTAPNPQWQATYMTEVTIIFYDEKNGKELGRYEAEDTRDYSYQLPDAFTNGEENLYDDANATLAVTLNRNDRFIVMEYKDAGVVLSVARLGYTYMLAVRQSRSLFLKSSGLLKEGCVPTDRNAVINESRRKRAAVDVCADVPAEYYEACKFDFAVTGNATMSAGTGSLLTAAIEETESRDINVVTEIVTTTSTANISKCNVFYSIMLTIFISLYRTF